MADKIRQNKILISAIINAQEKEKKQIGMELHDHINQILASTKMYMELAKSNEELRDQLIDTSTEQLAYAISEIRNLSKSMVLHSAEQGGVYSQVVELARIRSEAARIQVNHDIAEQLFSNLYPKVQIAIYRILEEQLNNIAKYAKAETVAISLKLQCHRLHLSITDDGQGFDVKKAKQGIGLSNIASRAELFNGNMDIVTAPGRGCTLSVSLDRAEVVAE